MYTEKDPGSACRHLIIIQASLYMRRSKFIHLATALFLISVLMACTHNTGPEKDATVRILGRRIGLQGAQLYPGKFSGLAITADLSCQQLPQKGMLPHMVFSLIARAIQETADDPFLAYDLKDVIQILGIDLNSSLDVINLTPELRSSVLQFICSFAQGVDRAKQNL